RRVERQIAEKRPCLVLLNECHRMVREVVGNETFAAHELAVVFERRVEILAPVAGGEAVIFFKTTRVRMIRPLATVVPFAEGARRVTRRLECLRDGCLVE